MRVLFGIFDWGLGHATRDIKLISALLEKGDSVDILSTGRALKLVRGYFKGRCRYFDVPSLYSPYTKSKFFTSSFIAKIPKMYSSLIRAEKLSKEIISAGNYDAVISDCRYDVHDRKDNSYFINHQVRFKSFPFAQGIIEMWLASRMNKYKYVLVPDFDNPNLSGELSHNLKFFNKSRIKYIGILSHIEFVKIKDDIDWFVSLSGPEPQRTLLEEKIIGQLKSFRGKIIVAGGNPDAEKKKDIKNIKFYSFLDSKTQGDIMNRAKFIVTRSGYTTIMELCELGKKKVLLIPTPGQTEQEYLGDYYEEKGYFNHVHRDDLDLKKDLNDIKNFNGFSPKWKTRESVRKFLRIIHSR